jgi:hypothetical protein
VLVSLCYVSLRWLLEFVALRARSKEFQELEIIVLRHELAILRRTTCRPAMTAVDRMLLAVASRLLPRARWRSFIVTPRRRSCAGIVAWSPGGGRSGVPSVVRRSGVRFETWFCDSLEKTRGGAIHGSSEN